VNQGSAKVSLTRAPKRVVVSFPKIDNLGEWAQVLAVRDQYDPLASAIAPHLTLVFPFEDSLSDSALHAHVARMVSDIPCFAVMLGEITAHENEYLFLNVKRGNDQLIHLHDALYSGVLASHLARSLTFVPHITVGRLSPGHLPTALESTRAFTSPIHARVDTVSAYLVDTDETRPVLFEIPLKY
jgi:2'-5' RNA ligase